MHRLFVALRPPAPIRELLDRAMDGVPDARWQDDEQLHLTLRFIGEVDARQAEDVAAALAGVRAGSVEVALSGVGSFDRKGAVGSLWAGVTPRDGLAALHAKVDRALVTAGIAPDRRAYLPHITLARLSRTAGRHPAVARWLVAHADLHSPRFVLDRLILYESTLARTGAHYTPVAGWPLSLR